MKSRGRGPARRGAAARGARPMRRDRERAGVNVAQQNLSRGGLKRARARRAVGRGGGSPRSAEAGGPRARVTEARFGRVEGTRMNCRARCWRGGWEARVFARARGSEPFVFLSRGPALSACGPPSAPARRAHARATALDRAPCRAPGRAVQREDDQGKKCLKTPGREWPTARIRGDADSPRPRSRSHPRPRLRPCVRARSFARSQPARVTPLRYVGGGAHRRATGRGGCGGRACAR